MSDSLLPPNATAHEDALAETVARMNDVPTPARLQWNPDTCPSEFLPWLAWAFSVDTWDASWTDSQKRSAIKAAVEVQKHKGTIGAVKNALAALGFDVQVQEWFNQIPEGEPYTYELLLNGNQIGIDQQALLKILSVVDSSKNLRSHMSALVPSVTTQATLYTGGTNCIGNEITIAYESGPSVLMLDGSWALDGSQNLDGIRN